MKVRLGFVSNSSSTSYVIAVTRDFKTNQESMTRFLEQYSKWGDDESVIDLESADRKVGEIIEALCTHEQIWDEEAPIDGIDSFISAFKEDVVLFTIDGGPDEGQTLNVLADSCKDKTMAKLTKLVGDNNEN